MGAYLETGEASDWAGRAQEIQGADPSQLPGRKLVAESCLVDLLAPMLAETSSIPEHLELVSRAGWCSWYAGHVEASPGVVPPDARSVSRYASELRALTADLLGPLLRDLILRLFQERPESSLERPLNATSVKRQLSFRVPWIHREMVNQHLIDLTAEGWLLSSSRGFRLAPEARERALPPLPAEVALAELFQDVYPALTAYVDLQPGAIAGQGGLIATPERLQVLAQAIDDALEEAMRPFVEAALERPIERRVLLHHNRLAGPVEDVWPIVWEDPAREVLSTSREDANAEVCRLGTFVAMAALPGWGDPNEAWRGLKGAVALHLQRTCHALPGGLYRAAHRQHGIGSGTLASYFDGPVLISRNNGKIRAVREGETARLERETLFQLSHAFPDARTERWLWEQLSARAEVFSFPDYRALLLKMARDGFVLMSKAGASRSYRAPRSFQAVPVLRMWDRWQKLWRWLPSLRKVAAAVRHGAPGATVRRGRWVVDREDLPRIEAQIQREVDVLIGGEIGRCAHLEEIDHLSMGGRKSQLVIFTRQEPWLLTQMEDPWEETTR